MVDTDRLDEAIDGTGDLFMKAGFALFGLALLAGAVGVEVPIGNLAVGVLLFGTVWALFVDT